MSKVLSAHQPNFLPYLGFFDKMQKSDVFVIRDEVQYCKDDFHRRNRIRINACDNVNDPQCKWIGVPAVDVKDYIMHVPIKQDVMQKGKTWKQLVLHEISASYSRAVHFERYYPELSKIVSEANGSLIDLNMKLILFLARSFGIEKEIVFASSLGLKPLHMEKSDASEDLVAICKKLGADIYLSGDGGRGYLDLVPFQREGVEVRFQDYKHPTYSQAFPGFLPNMAAIDALFCKGGIPNE